ncbi:MAG: hypothetical protein ACREXS_11435, partial [Gammaproteobacteria bacterium]
RADPIMARADTTLNKRPDIYTQSFLTAIGVSLLANRVESIYTIPNAGLPMARKKKLPPQDHVMRYVSWNKLRKNEKDEVIGILGEAFKMRDSDKSLSTTWLEYFLGSREEQITAAVRAVRASKLEVKPKSGFAIGGGLALFKPTARRSTIRFASFTSRRTTTRPTRR